MRSIGKSNLIAAAISNQKKFDKLFQFLFNENRVVTMRAADAIEKITLKHPAFLEKYKEEILLLMNNAVHKELKWHIALLLSRLSLNKAEQQKVWKQLVNWLCDPEESKIVRVNSLQALYEMNQKYKTSNSSLSKVIDKLKNESPAAIIARLKKLNVLNH